MNIIELIKSILTEFPKINELHIDFNENTPDAFGLYPTGDMLISEDVLGNQKRRHNFILYVVFQSFNDYDRLSNSGALLELHMWLERQAKGQIIETEIDGDKLSGVLKKLTCSNGMLFNIPENNMNDGVQYQIQIAAEYTIESEVV